MILIIALISSIGVAVVSAIAGDLVSEEVRGWLDLLPQATLRLAANIHLNPSQYVLIYDDEWMPELTYILKGAESRPISRLIVGMRFASSLLFSRMNIETPYPSIFTLAPKDLAIKSILERIGSELDRKPRELEEASTFRYGVLKRNSYKITVGGVAVSLDRYRELYKAGTTILLDMGHERLIPLTMDEFREIADRLESMTGGPTGLKSE